MRHIGASQDREITVRTDVVPMKNIITIHNLYRASSPAAEAKDERQGQHGSASYNAPKTLLQHPGT